MTLWKCGAQYARKFGKFLSGHRTGKGQFSFQSQWKAMPKNFPVIAQLHSFHMLSRLFSKSFKLDFSSIWTENIKMYNLYLEKAKEPEIKLPTSAGSQKKQGNWKKNCFCFTDYAKAFDYVEHSKLGNILKKIGLPDHITCLLRNVYTGQEAIVRSGHGTTDWFQIGKEVHQGCILSPCLFNLYAEYIVWNTGLDDSHQHCQENYQQLLEESSRKTSISALLNTPKPLTVWIKTNWKILTKMGIPDHLNCLLRNPYADQEATVRTRQGKQTGSKLGKEYVKAVYCHSATSVYWRINCNV